MSRRSDMGEQWLEELAERRYEERQNPPPEPEPIDPYMPGGRFWPPTLDVLREVDP